MFRSLQVLEARQAFTGQRRFIHTPRDLATYAHFLQIHQQPLSNLSAMLKRFISFLLS